MEQEQIPGKNLWQKASWFFVVFWYNAVDLLLRDCISKSFLFVVGTGYFLYLIVKASPDLTKADGATLASVVAIMTMFTGMHLLAWVNFVHKKWAPLILKAMAIVISGGRLKDFSTDFPSDDDITGEPGKKKKGDDPDDAAQPTSQP